MALALSLSDKLQLAIIADAFQLLSDVWVL